MKGCSDNASSTINRRANSHASARATTKYFNVKRTNSTQCGRTYAIIIFRYFVFLFLVLKLYIYYIWACVCDWYIFHLN